MALNTLSEQFRIFTTLGIINCWCNLVYIGEQIIAGVVDYGGKHKIANISANLRKKSKRLKWETQRPGVNSFMKKKTPIKSTCILINSENK